MALSQCIKRRHLAQKNFEFHAGVKKCHFGNFSERAGMAVPCQCSPQESLGGSEKFFLHWVLMNPQQCWKAKLERALFCRVQSGKIIVCIFNISRFKQQAYFSKLFPQDLNEGSYCQGLIFTRHSGNTFVLICYSWSLALCLGRQEMIAADLIQTSMIFVLII